MVREFEEFATFVESLSFSWLYPFSDNTRHGQLFLWDSWRIFPIRETLNFRRWALTKRI